MPEGVCPRCVRSLLLIAIIVLSSLTPPSAWGDPPLLAILDLRPLGPLTEDQATSLTGYVRSAVFRTNAFTLINREDMFAIARNHEIELRICHEDACLLRFGRLAKAQKLLVGDVDREGAQTIIHLRLVRMPPDSCTSDTDTLRNEYTTSISFSGKDRDNSIESLARELAIHQDPQCGWVLVRFGSYPEGARVDVRDHLVCETNCARPLRPGPYSVTMAQSGYLTRRGQIDVYPGMEPVSWVLTPLPPPSRTGAGWRSALVPGWGQWYRQERTKGGVLFLSGAASIATAGIAWTERASHRRQWDAATEDNVRAWHEDRANLYETAAYIAAAVGGAVYVYGLMDAITTDTDHHSSGSLSGVPRLPGLPLGRGLTLRPCPMLGDYSMALALSAQIGD